MEHKDKLETKTNTENGNISNETTQVVSTINNEESVKDKLQLQKENLHLQEQLQMQEKMITQLQQQQMQEFQQKQHSQQQQMQEFQHQHQLQLQNQQLQLQKQQIHQLHQNQINLHENNEELSHNVSNNLNLINEDGINNAHDEEEIDDKEGKKPVRRGRGKIKIEYIKDKSRRHITFSKRKGGIMKKAYELTTLTGTQALLLVASETGHVYTFATPKLQPLITKPEGKNLIQSCLNAPDNVEQEEEEVVKTEDSINISHINEMNDHIRSMQMNQIQNQLNIPINRNIQFNQFSPIANSNQMNQYNQNINNTQRNYNQIQNQNQNSHQIRLNLDLSQNSQRNNNSNNSNNSNIN
jgi:hypothetical protein